MKIVILGCGRVGARLAQLLEAEGHQVTIVDKESAAFSKLENFKGTRVLGNGIDVDLLKKAGIENAQAFAAVTNGDNTNLMTAQMAQKIFNVPKVVCRVYDPKRAGIYYDLGLQTVCSTTVGARMIRNLLTGPTLLRAYHLGDASAQAIEVKIGPKAAGKRIAELEIPGEFLISAIIRNEAVIVPDKNDQTQADDQVFGVALVKSVEKVKTRLDVTALAVNFV